VQIEFDNRVPEELIRLIEHRIIDDDSLDAWVDLPGNEELLRQGAARHELDREMLRENLWHSILGHSERRGTGLGTLAIDPPGDLVRMIDELNGRREEITSRVAAQIESYLPEGSPGIHATVRLHLGGTWDGRAREDVYLNLSFLHTFDPPWFSGAEGILAHEIAHLVHRVFDGPPEEASTPEGLFAVALAQIHSEGMAREIESGALPETVPPRTYAAFVRAKYGDDLAGFPAAVGRLVDLRKTCLDLRDAATCRRLINAGLWRGGESYAIGHGMARAIEAALGRKTLATTFQAGGARFFQLYVQATKMLHGLPQLDEGVERALPAADLYLTGRREIWTLRRAQRLAFDGRDYAAAEKACRRLAELTPDDPIVAYNLACALARQGRDAEALDWLERSIREGYADRPAMEKDPDLDSLRDGKSYRRFLELLGSIGSSAPNNPRK
jgi:hypothetical protein